MTIKLIAILKHQIAAVDEEIKAKTRKPKILFCSTVLEHCQTIASQVNRVLRFLNGQMSEEDYQQAERYWDEVDSWAEL